MAETILVVDDEKDLSAVVSAALKKAGYSVEVINNGREALGAYIESLEKKIYALIILDIKMPGMGGLEVLEKIRKEEELRGILIGSGIPVIMLTAFGEKWAEAFKKGCDDYLTKPFKIEELVRKVKNKLEEKKKK